jgi:diguanylate cyclase (GGDEF)-like protein
MATPAAEWSTAFGNEDEPTIVLPKDAFRTILLAEDDPVARLMTTRLLQKAGYEVVAVQNGVEALARLKDCYFPLLLTDWEMPELDGIGLCREVRQRHWDGYVYTILLTARDSSDNLVAGLNAGADDYLTKPFENAELIARLKTGHRILELERSLRVAQKEATRLSITDPLTGAYNRRHLMHELPRELERSRRFSRPVSLVLCDIDHFKKINDTYGHPVGDEVLRQFADCLTQQTRRGIDWLTRYGGEEFVIVLPETDIEGALGVAEKLRASVAAMRVNSTAGAITLTASFGVSSFSHAHRDSTATPEQLIELADLCLYQSKQQGRDRVTGRELEIP